MHVQGISGVAMSYIKHFYKAIYIKQMCGSKIGLVRFNKYRSDPK